MLRSISPNTSYTECCARIEKWTVEDTPEMFGLPHALTYAVSAAESQKFHCCLHTMESAMQEKV